MHRLLRENALSIVLIGFFLTFLAGQSITGYHVDREDRQEQGRPPIGYVQYLQSPHFIEATMENWESEFLQMFVFVLLSVFLLQKGSTESRKLHGKEEVDEDPRRHRTNKTAPWPVRKGGLWLRLYEGSLSIAFALLFLLAFLLHSVGGAGVYNEEQIAKGHEAVSTVGYMGTARFWFESMQNWQSEFLAIGAMVVLTIFLRQRGSPQSKPVHAPHAQTGK